MFKIVKRYYSKGYYSKDGVKVFVRTGDITVDEYKEITEEEYSEN